MNHTDDNHYRQTHRRRRRKRRTGRILFLLFISAIVIIAYKLTDGFGYLSVPVSADRTNIQTEFDIDLQYLAACADAADGSFCPDNGDVERLKKVGEENPQYKEKINFFIDHISAYNQTAVNSILLSPEKTDFVILAPFANQTMSASWDINVKKGTVPYLLQYDSRWAFHGYGSSCIGNTACGPTCLSMAAIGLTGNAQYTPDYVSDFATQNGYYVDGTGTAWSLYTDGAPAFGIKGEQIYTNKNQMKTCLENGGVLIASVLPGDFTMAGHFIVIYDFNMLGFKVYDPSSIERSSRTWTFDALQPQIAQVWCMTGM